MIVRLFCAYLVLWMLVEIVQCPQKLFAQGSPNLAFERYSTEKGLPQNSVYAILQDKRGFLWMGTQDGLCRYDGYEFVVYRHQNRTANTIVSNFVSSLAEDAQGNIWVGTQSRGLSRINTRTGSISTFANDTLSKGSISNNVIWKLWCDKQGQIYAGTSEGANIFDATTGKFFTIKNNPTDSNSLSHNQVRAFAESSDGSLWIGTQNGLNKYNPQTRTITRFWLPVSPQMPTNNFITALFMDNKGILWIGTDAGMINRFDPRSGISTQIQCNQGENLADNYIRAIAQDALGRLWIGTNTGGLLCLNPATNEMTTYKYDQLNTKSLPDNTVISLLVEPSGTLWVGTNNGGVCKTSPYRPRFTSIGEKTTFPLHPASVQLQSTIVRAILEDNQGNVWIGTRGGGLYRFSPSEHLLQKIDLHTERVSNIRTSASKIQPQKISRQKTTISSNTLPSERIWSLLQDRTGAIWIGTDDGVFVLDNATKRVISHIQNSPNDSTSLSSNLIRSLCQDRDGTVWIGTRNEGLNKYNPTSRTNTIFKNNPAQPRSLPANNVWSLLQDRQGTIWVGTVAGGLARFDAARGDFTVFRANADDSTALINDIVWSLTEDRTGTLWAGTNSGLAGFNAASNTFTSYTRTQGLPNDVVYGVVEGTDGNLWLSTNSGLAKFNSQTGEVRNYEATSGLQDNEFNGNACFRGASGMVYFGGPKGWTMFYPDSIRDRGFKPLLAITNLRRTTPQGMSDEIVHSVEVITIAPNTYTFSLDVAALDFTAPEKLRYRYYLQGFDNDWTYTDAQHRRIMYTNLPAGEYTFIAEATNSDGIWSKNRCEARIIVIPPWWQTWWFRLGIVLGIGAIIVGWVQWRLYATKRDNKKLAALVEARTHALEEANHEMELVNAQLNKQNEELKELNNEKNEFLGIVSHDLKNPISAIRGMSEILLESEVDDVTHKILTTVVNTSDRMLDLVKNLLDINQMETHGIPLAIIQCPVAPPLEMKADEYTSPAQEKSITFNVQIENAVDKIYADEQALMQVLDNLISNAVKYSPHHKTIWISAHTLGEKVQIRIRDEGPGMTEEDMKRLFGKFAKLSARPTGNEHSTGLGLSIVKRLVESMNGKIWCESEYGKGATFVLEMPRVV